MVVFKKKPTMMMAPSYCLRYPSNAHFSCFPSALMTFGEWWLAAVLEENTSKYDLNKNGSLAQEKKPPPQIQ